MKHTIVFVAITVLSVSITLAQSTKSVVRLKNGVLMKGEIVEFVQGEYMIMHVMDGYDMRIPAENIQSFKIKKGKLASYNAPENGYFNYTSAGFLFLRTNSFSSVDVNMSVHTLNGYRLFELYSTGLGIGLDRYGTLSSLPVYLSIRRDLKASRVTPVFNANVGYGWMWESDSFNEWEDYETVKGGIYWELGAGLRINYKKTALLFNYAYKRQNSQLTSVNNNWWWRSVESLSVEKHKFRNMVLTVGLEF
jgi:hypothetical protein